MKTSTLLRYKQNISWRIHQLFSVSIDAPLNASQNAPRKVDMLLKRLITYLHLATAMLFHYAFLAFMCFVSDQLLLLPCVRKCWYTLISPRVSSVCLSAAALKFYQFPKTGHQFNGISQTLSRYIIFHYSLLMLS